MRTPHRYAAIVLALVIALGLGIIAPVHSAYDKAYRFRLPSGWTQADALAVRATLNAMEIVTGQYDGWWNPYEEGAISYPVLSGVYCTRIRYQPLREPQIDPNTGEPWSWDQALKIGWSTSDSSCRLRDLKWIKTDHTSTNVGIAADQSAVPGGGELVNIGGQWFWRIWNDPPLEPPDDPNEPPEFLPIILHEVETWAFEEPLTQEELYQTTETGMSTDNVSCIIETLIPELRAAVANAGDMPPGWIRSLTGKLDRAAADAEAGLVAFRPPNLDEPAARFLWGRAAQHVKTFVSQVQNRGGKKAPQVPAEWISAAQEIMARLLALPGAPSFEGVAALRDGSLSTAPGEEVPPGGYVDVPLEGVAPGDAVVIHGVITDPPDGGEVVLEWSEQAIIPADTDPPTPTITPAPDYYDEAGVGHYSNNPGMVTLSCADPDFAAMYYGFCTGQDGDELPLNVGGSVVQVNFQPSRQLVYFAQDTSGNTSNHQIVVVDELFVDDDWTGPGNCGGHLWQVDAFDNVQDAVDVTQTGFTVFVEDGTYPGGIEIPNSIMLTSQSGDPTACIIDGGGTLQCINLPYGDNEVIISGFGIRNGSGTHGPGLGVYNQSKAVVTNCIFSDNSSSHMGGAIYVGGGYSLTELVAVNCVLVGNSAANYGGGLGVHGSHGRAALTNCTLTGNSAGQQGGAAYATYTVANITANNCIFWGDSAPAYPELRLNLSGPSPIAYSDVQGGWLGTGNLDADPLFANAGAREFHLRSVEGRWYPPTSAWVIDSVHSPCIDSGDPASSYADEPEPNGERINMGAYGNTAEASKTGSPPDTMWVDDDWTGPGNCGGHEWQVNAFNIIQDAIDAAPADYSIYVAAGTYEEHLTWTSKPLSLTGAGAGKTIVDGTKSGRCLTMTDVPEGSEVEGFTFTNGEVPVTVAEECGGVLISGGAPTLRNNAVTHNISHSDFGGGVECWTTGAVFEDNLIANNEGFNTGGFWCGGFSGVLRGNTIIDNTSQNAGGVFISNRGHGGSDYVIEGNTIAGNYGRACGAMKLDASTWGHYLVAGNQIRDNSAHWFIAGMEVTGDSGSSYTLINNVVAGNTLTQAYRPAALSITGGIEAILVNNTVAHNAVEGVRADSLGPRTITNCIMWDNATADLCGIPWWTGPVPDPVPTPVQLTYSDVGVIGTYVEVLDGTGTISADPLFVNAAGGDFRLSAASPCIDTGDKDAPDLPETDIEGNPRIVNAQVDMGAYEYQGEGGSSASGLTIASASAAPTGVGAEIIFTLSRDADVAVSVLNIAGRPIRRVATNRAATAGRNSILWNACSDNGLRVPNGAYLIQIEAKTKDGAASRALTQVRIVR